MTFHTLEDRFKANASTIYGRYGNADQLAEIKPDTSDSRSRIKNDSRAFPIVSTGRDLKLMGNFLKSLDKGGPQFLATQTLLQTGNTFAETRLYNPLGTLIHTIPFVHTPRNIGKLPQIVQPIREFRGGLQSETLKKFSTAGPTNSVSRFISGVTNAATSPFQALSSSPVTGSGGFYLRPEDSVEPGLLPRESIQFRGTPKNVGNRLPVRTLSGQIQKYITKTSNGYTGESVVPSAQKVFRQLEIDSSRYLATEFKYNYLSTGSVWDENVKIAQNKSGLVSNIKDVYNTKTFNTREAFEKLPTLQSGSLVYEKISGEKEKHTDIIPFIFNSVDKSEPIHFRAFISSLKQSVKPEFNETRYVGRTERFVTYAGAKRTATLQFNIVAFSELELDSMWLRINYLTGLAFPKGVSTSGFMVPPLFRLTVGGIYDSQPCYIESLDFDLLDESITFDIDKHVSQVINVNMSVTLLEKRSSFYDSPFYGIAQKIQAQDLAKANSYIATRESSIRNSTQQRPVTVVTRPPALSPQINIPAPTPTSGILQLQQQRQAEILRLEAESDAALQQINPNNSQDFCRGVDPANYNTCVEAFERGP